MNALMTFQMNDLMNYCLKPKIGCSTVGELAGFTFYHETYHFGQIHAMKRLD